MYGELIDELCKWIAKDENFFDPASYPLKNKVAKAEILLKEDNVVVSGIEIIELLSKKFCLETLFKVRDGQLTSSGVVGNIKGCAYDLLVCERTFLNILSIMSATATRTYQLVQKIRKLGYNTKIAATRKVLPFVGELQKLAVIHGGGDSHRWNLFETIMIKDNHKKLYGSISKAVEEIRKLVSFTKKIEVEVEAEEELEEAIESEVDIIMLDNFPPEKVKELARRIKSRNPKILVEASGGINEETVEEYLCPDLDVISIGRLTSEIRYVDFSLEVVDSL
ncbi:carboxylating nicotinate-nucleotide diphosphorylase [Pseudothermotoga thermarum]|uniref:nicotinate-nucleotide diphosphorylase (carboxylating) n=1 Tax=Pseudothermotoga thermarum DSM 5069 TaxID=688269 RepID=F7YWX8_9THEM|nr:carboxylating nicotinate-nucleotide diphosphorylase [Pseudothermotoga thermarum]AEH50570.1 nicotinate-nucleotide pyrophosphorylase (carboxylating) [Pseudothermotoga thermarum DSM 5069]